MKMKQSKKILAVSLSLLASFSLALPKVERVARASDDASKPVVNPIAKYEFKDATNPGKDSMGNYDLSVVNSGSDAGTIAIADGAATFNGSAGLVPASENVDISENLTSFTLAYEVKAEKTGSWTTPIGFGWNGWDATKWASFQFGDNSDLLRFSSANSLVEGKSDIDGNANPYWGSEIGTAGDDFHKVILSVGHDSKMTVYFDGVAKYNYTIPANFTLKDGNMRFAIGGDSCWGNIYNAFTGSLKNVEIYDFAFDGLQALAYGLNGQLDTSDIAEQQAIDPLAKYEFNDATNPGKDSMGKHDLVKYGDGNVTVANGVASFDGAASLASATKEGDIGEKVTSYSLAFDIKTTATNSSWAEPIGFGWNDWSCTKWSVFSFAGGSDLLRFSTASELVEGDVGNVDGNSNQWWAPEIGSLGTTDTHSVLLTVEVGGKANVYLDGVLKYSYNVPANYSLASDNALFALGGNATWLSFRNGFIGELSNVEVYDFAFNDLQTVQYINTGVAYRALDVKVVSAVADLSESIKVPAEATDSEIMLYAPKTSLVDVTMSNDSTQQAEVEWTNVKDVEGVKYLEGTIKGLVNTDDVKALAKIALVENTVELLPIAKYEFLDATNPGKDSMGKYDLVVTNSTADVPGTVVVENGVAKFDGSAALVAASEEADVTEDLTSYTLSFSVKTAGNNEGWAEPIGFGWNGWDATRWSNFSFSGGSDLLRFTTASVLNENNGLGNVDANANQFWGKEIGNLGTDSHNVVLSVNLEGTIDVYLDGALKYSYATPEGYTLSDSVMKFAIGGSGSLNSVQNPFIGEVSNVAIYDFAVNALQAKVLGGTAELRTNLVDGAYIASVATTPVFENNTTTSSALNEDMSEADMLALVNNATVTATLSDETTKDLAVVWSKVEMENDVYTLVGYADAAHSGVLTAVAGTEVRVALTVEKVEQPQPSVSETPSEEPSVSETPSEEPSVSETPSEVPSTPVEEPSTPVEEPTQPGKKGCKGSTGATLFAIITLIGALSLNKKRK